MAMFKEKIQQLKEAVWRERVTLFRYFMVGGTSFVVKFLAYVFQSRLVWRGGSESIQNIIALIAAMIYNYTLHRFWTFRHQAPAPGSAHRYILVTILWNSVDAGMFWLLHDVFHVYDLLILFINSGTIMFASFFTHRLFTFHSNPWKKKATEGSG